MSGYFKAVFKATFKDSYDRKKELGQSNYFIINEDNRYLDSSKKYGKI